MRNKEMSIWEELELGLGGGSKFRILKHLALNPDESFTKYALSKASGLRTSSVETYLKTLLELSWILKHDFVPKTYQINVENDVVKYVTALLQDLKHL